MPIADLRMCGICFRVLNRTGSAYQHPIDPVLRIAHQPEPVPVDGRVKILCDFCAAETPQVEAWTVPVERFAILVDPYQTAWSDPAYAACGACAELIGANRWALLLRRAINNLERRGGRVPPEVTRYNEDHLLAVRMHMLGPPYLESELEAQ